ncbi:hypothetical protein [Paenibacillus cymbidii]|uniref:hypothetical protein n=1 Tax=Paenibacillus cymbidii TaxID=1639034 RepID=UPI00108113E4|nr:hypothetical protein [Paenibacillus cymbidii]
MVWRSGSVRLCFPDSSFDLIDSEESGKQEAIGIPTPARSGSEKSPVFLYIIEETQQEIVSQKKLGIY